MNDTNVLFIILSVGLFATSIKSVFMDNTVDKLEKKVKSLESSLIDLGVIVSDYVPNTANPKDKTIEELEEIKKRISKECGYDVRCDVMDKRIKELKGE